jgi:hypothetical protein
VKRDVCVCVLETPTGDYLARARRARTNGPREWAGRTSIIIGAVDRAAPVDLPAAPENVLHGRRPAAPQATSDCAPFPPLGPHNPNPADLHGRDI